MPAVNFDLMYQAMVRDAKAGPALIRSFYWSKLSDWKNQTLTPNPDAVYLCRSSTLRKPVRSYWKSLRRMKTDRSLAR
jgi:hypothetical protein